LDCNRKNKRYSFFSISKGAGPLLRGGGTEDNSQNSIYLFIFCFQNNFSKHNFAKNSDYAHSVTVIRKFYCKISLKSSNKISLLFNEILHNLAGLYPQASNKNYECFYLNIFKTAESQAKLISKWIQSS